ncbi:MAG: TonB-dependent siderophore receptor [Acidobacteria bacterium]|nr:MAG: TonB-dependent siderophore receptor [Acidobacteriota bacterium]
MRRLLVIFFASFLLAFPVATAHAGQLQSALHGKILDASRSPLPGARIMAVADHDGATASTISDRSGDFTLLLESDRYTIKISAEGFVEIVHRINLVGDSTERREFVLQLAGVGESVSVSASADAGATMISSGMKIATPLRDVPQSITIVSRELIKDQLMMGVGDTVRYVPGITYHQGENNRDQVVIRGNSSSADFFVDGVRDDVQYYRDLYNLDRLEALKGPNAMIFGRGGGGGVINRVIKQPTFQPLREFTVQGGEYGNKRVAADVGQPLSRAVAIRLNGMFEDSGSFRQAVSLRRVGVNPTLLFVPDIRTKITVGYEYLRDTRVADRGITSYQGKPASVGMSTFYGNPSDSYVRAQVHLGSVTVERRIGEVNVRSHTLIGGYDRSYQNYVPGPASADGTQVTVAAYNNATQRLNVFNQTDAVYVLSTGPVRHTLLAGAEIGRQATVNFRNSGFFNNQQAAIQLPFDNPTVTVPVTFRQNATDADNHVITNVAAVLAQDRLELSHHVQVIGGIRLDRFDLRYHNNRNGNTLERVDNLVSPRIGMVVKPTGPLSLYGSYGVSYLPSSGDQFSSLTTITQQVRPEKFNNYEVGLKLDTRGGLSITGAVYRLDRINTRSIDPNDPTRIVQTGSQRTNGYELGVNGHVTAAWSVTGGYAYQNAFVTSATASARSGAQVGQVPRHTFSLWNNYRIHPKVGVGMGVTCRSDMFAAIDNTVTLPAYTRADGAAYFTLRKGVRVQANVENLLNKKYFLNADSNTNISPGFPRTLRVALTAGF